MDIKMAHSVCRNNNISDNSYLILLALSGLGNKWNRDIAFDLDTLGYFLYSRLISKKEKDGLRDGIRNGLPLEYKKCGTMYTFHYTDEMFPESAYALIPLDGIRRILNSDLRYRKQLVRYYSWICGKVDGRTGIGQFPITSIDLETDERVLFRYNETIEDLGLVSIKHGSNHALNTYIVNKF